MSGKITARTFLGVAVFLFVYAFLRFCLTKVSWDIIPGGMEMSWKEVMLVASIAAIIAIIAGYYLMKQDDLNNKQESNERAEGDG